MVSDYRQLAFEKHGKVCAWCGTAEDLQVHHRDGDRNNNQPENLLPLCRDCHVRLHNRGLDGLEDELLPIEERSHIDPNTTTFSLRVSDDVWAAWKETVPRSKSLETRIVELIEADTEGRVIEATDDE